MNKYKYFILFVIVLCSAWSAFAFVAVPPVIDDAYHRRAGPFLDRLIAGRSVYPVEYYLGLWDDIAWGVDLAIIASFCLAMALPLLPSAEVSEGSLAAKPNGPNRSHIFVASSILLAVTVLAGARHDYPLYLQFWGYVMAGEDPWKVVDGRTGSSNNYGPLFNPLALLAGVNPYLPKILFSAAWIVVAAAAARLWSIRRGGGWMPFTMLAILGPYMWVENVLFGHFDILVFFFIALSIYISPKMPISQGVALGCGVLLKFAPIVALPFLAAGRDAARPRMAIASMLTILAGLSCSVLAWGWSTFRPLVNASNRGPSGLSIYVFLNSIGLPVGNPGLFGTVATCAALGVVAAAFLSSRIDRASALVLAACVILAFGKMGYPQYHTYLVAGLALWVASSLANTRPAVTRFSVSLYLFWISAFDLWCFTQEDPWQRSATWAPLLTFLCLLFLIYGVFTAAWLKGSGAGPDETQRSPA